MTKSKTKIIFYKGNIYLNIFFLLLSVSIVSMACKTRKKNKDALIETTDTLSVLLNFSSHAFQFENIQAKLNISVDNKEKVQSFAATARIKRDSIIWISVAPFLGVEVFRIVFTQDSVKILNRLENSYFLSDINGLKDILQADIDYNMLQAVITGNDFPHFDFNVFQVKDDGEFYVLKADKRAKQRNIYNNSNLSLKQQIFLNKEFFRIQKNNFNDIAEKYKIEVMYLDFKNIENQNFAHNIKAKLTNNKEIWDIGVAFLKVQLFAEQTYPFSIPDKYTKMP